MVSYVLDTNVVSALMRGDSTTEERLLRESPTSVYLTQPVIAEVRYGLARLPRSRRRTELTSRFELLTNALPRQTWSDDVSARYGVLKAALELSGTRLEDFDLAIAAHALTLRARLATRNVKHFSRIADLEIDHW
jgi:predicted nucleic acid-binding protein